MTLSLSGSMIPLRSTLRFLPTLSALSRCSHHSRCFGSLQTISKTHKERRNYTNAWSKTVALSFCAASIVGLDESKAEQDQSKVVEPVASRTLYAPIEPYNSGMLKVSETHHIYWEESGNPKGKPVIFVHGGPGGGCTASSRQYFNPELYRCICVDQRGSGKSLPAACLEDNTTWHLVNDMERVRQLLEIDKWQVFGGSWGSTLALAYAEKHPERVSELILRGIFMLRPHELRWFYQEGASFLFPDAWEDYAAAIPPEERDDYLKAYSKRLTSDDESVSLPAAKAWSKWEMCTSALRPKASLVERADDEKWALAFARIENHFFVHGGWFPTPNYLIDNVDRIRHIPCTIVQGRYDVVCPMTTSYDLHKAWPEAKYRIVTSGHSASEPEVIHELVSATDLYALESIK